MINTIINDLLILEELRFKKGNENQNRDYLKYRCVCGKIGISLKKHIISGHTKSCGCKRARKHFKLNAKKVPQLDAQSKYYNQYVHDANNRGIEFSLSKKQFTKITSLPCNYCGQEPSREVNFKNQKLLVNGLDRVDNKAGYHNDNVVACCTQCNMSKGKLNKSEFLNWVNRIHLYQSTQRGVTKSYKFGGYLTKTIPSQKQLETVVTV
ncbi:MAG: hypothetical protein ACK5U7_13575 [Bacteroidota bacterium]|jgi:hypothetical protein